MPHIYLKIFNNMFKQNFIYTSYIEGVDKGDKSDNNCFMWPFTCLFINLLNYLVKFQIIYKLDSILNVIIDK